MRCKSILLVAVLALSSCQDKETKETAAISAPAVAPASAAVAETVVVKPDTSSAVAVTTPAVPVVAPKAAASAAAQNVAPSAPKAVTTIPVADKPPVTTPTPKPEVAAELPAKPEAVPAVVKPTAVAEAVSPKVIAPTVSDADGIALAEKRNCFACHLVEKKVVGPAWKDVAAKYRGDAGAQARIEAKIGKGGSGAWGSMAMPPQPQVTPEERALLARFILNLK